MFGRPFQYNLDKIFGIYVTNQLINQAPLIVNVDCNYLAPTTIGKIRQAISAFKTNADKTFQIIIKFGVHPTNVLFVKEGPDVFCYILDAAFSIDEFIFVVLLFNTLLKNEIPIIILTDPKTRLQIDHSSCALFAFVVALGLEKINHQELVYLSRNTTTKFSDFMPFDEGQQKALCSMIEVVHRIMPSEASSLEPTSAVSIFSGQTYISTADFMGVTGAPSIIRYMQGSKIYDLFQQQVQNPAIENFDLFYYDSGANQYCFPHFFLKDIFQPQGKFKEQAPIFKKEEKVVNLSIRRIEKLLERLGVGCSKLPKNIYEPNACKSPITESLIVDCFSKFFAPDSFPPRQISHRQFRGGTVGCGSRYTAMEFNIPAIDGNQVKNILDIQSQFNGKVLPKAFSGYNSYIIIIKHNSFRGYHVYLAEWDRETEVDSLANKEDVVAVAQLSFRSRNGAQTIDIKNCDPSNYSLNQPTRIIYILLILMIMGIKNIKLNFLYEHYDVANRSFINVNLTETAAIKNLMSFFASKPDEESASVALRLFHNGYPEYYNDYFDALRQNHPGPRESNF